MIQYKQLHLICNLYCVGDFFSTAEMPNISKKYFNITEKFISQI